MGFHLSVEAIQHVGCKLAVSSPPSGAGLNIPELTGNNAFPIACPLGLQTWHQTYLDNWDQFISLPVDMSKDFCSLPSTEQLLLREAWTEQKVVRSEHKTLEGVTEAKTLGVLWDGL
eukprot:10351087-Karenia_brevis.AAC.1